MRKTVKYFVRESYGDYYYIFLKRSLRSPAFMFSVHKKYLGDHLMCMADLNKKRYFKTVFIFK